MDRRRRFDRRKAVEAAEVGPIPGIVHPARREACRQDLLLFLQTYFPDTTGLDLFSSDHIRVIDRIEYCLRNGGRFVNAVYRGFAKTTITENAALWATSSPHEERMKKRWQTFRGSRSGESLSDGLPLPTCERCVSIRSRGACIWREEQLTELQIEPRLALSARKFPYCQRDRCCCRALKQVVLFHAVESDARQARSPCDINVNGPRCEPDGSGSVVYR